METYIRYNTSWIDLKDNILRFAFGPAGCVYCYPNYKSERLDVLGIEPRHSKIIELKYDYFMGKLDKYFYRCSPIKI